MIKTLSLRYLLPCVLSIAAPAVAAEPPAPSTAAQATPPAAAQAPNGASEADKTVPDASLVELVNALSKFLTEEETKLVYDYLWDSSVAALKGGDPEEVTLPPEVAFKLAILQKRIVKEGGFYLEGLARKMEQDLARWRERMLTPSPPVPYSLPSERNGQTY